MEIGERGAEAGGRDNEGNFPADFLLVPRHWQQLVVPMTRKGKV